MLIKKHRLTTRYEYGKVRRDGTHIPSRFFHLYYLKRYDPTEDTKVGIVVSNKFSKSAPERNHLKRIFREIIRTNFGKIKSGYWIVVHPKFNAKEAKYEKINLDFLKILQKSPFAQEL
ncbi:MAG TPA: ribonuclease P protein component [candidate division WWE3 bacterium]|uniref:Ribonuclease P protein component n=1 Tax=candidate division WWE3 bacterium TaxID=2053526 RepID=A0A7C1HGT8_UNCKA|nr:ribonuclease P protein component [candidate division WWE3 bacterium]